jgi:hypothetical protein
VRPFQQHIMPDFVQAARSVVDLRRVGIDDNDM